MFRNAAWQSTFVSPPISKFPSGEDIHLLDSRLLENRKPDDSPFEISIINTSEQSSLACDLINRMYGWRGYGSDHKLSADTCSSTFVASAAGEILGTLTLTVDSPAGLTADRTFSDVIDKARQAPGASLCELTKFASQPSQESKHLLAAMFHTIFVYGSERYRCSDIFIEVNPRHIRFYESMLGFTKVGDLRTNETVDAPSQLMLLKVSDIDSYIDLYSRGAGRVARHSLYPLFFSRDVERTVRNVVKDRFAPAMASPIRLAN